MKRDDATQAQVRAARPDVSTWLAANAGSGKTRVLTDRVARLLLNGVYPEKILCLTYTKAAASEMQNRLFQRLGQWAMMSDDDLREALDTLGYDGQLDAPKLAKARSLFACAIEAPGGLKIQTIHAFCSAVLRRFPLEAGVSPQFKEMEDRAGEMLRADILQDMADGPDAPIIAALAAHLTDADFSGITNAVIGARERFDPTITDNTLADLLGVPAGMTEDQLLSRTLLGDEADLMAELIPLLKNSSSNDAKAAAKLERIKQWDLQSLAVLETVLLTGGSAKSPFSAKIGAFPVKALRTNEAAHLMDRLENLMRRVEDARGLRLGLATLAKARVLHDFARAFLPRYAQAKQARGWLDFDDLILKTRDLLSDPQVASWVLYRLDGGIDHILVDEAQDTSPVQWNVVDHLTQEFTAGSGARDDAGRTVFVVGDKKQSIYSFQGADPTGFDRMRDHFRDKLTTIGAEFQDAALEFSFRSSETILSLVDVVFEGRDAAGFSSDIRHRAFKSDMPGRVDLWPFVEKAGKDEPRHWTDTVDHIEDTHHDVRLAQHIAKEVARLLKGDQALPVKDGDTWIGRKIEPRDILVLVQRRSTLFHEIIRACKSAELPIAGADRLKVGGELAVRDLAALLSWIALPEDDLSLATVLKSPLFGWSEQKLFSLAHGRGKKYLWRVLEARAEEHQETWNMLRDLRDNSDFLRPYDLVERILIKHDGRARLLARLGPEAEDGINAFLEQAITYESTEVPSLTGFLVWMKNGDLEIKRQPDAASNQIRVMTVHGSKGLEAPIVIMPDCGKRDSRINDIILSTPDTPLWRPRANEQPAVMQPWIEATKEKIEQERDRLLYVAMTRAENWLIVAAAGEADKNATAWHDRVKAAMAASGANPAIFGALGEGLRLQTPEWPANVTQDSKDAPSLLVSLPDWVERIAPDPLKPVEVLTPTGLGGAKALPGEAGQDEDAAMAYGTAVHHWLETLIDAPNHPAPEDATARKAFDEAKRAIDAPHLSNVFAPTGLSEVPVFAHVPLINAPMRGTIDRLIVSESEVLAVDFKTNATVPKSLGQVPDGLLRQMGAYAHMLAEIYPNHKIRTALLWTNTAELTELPHDLVTDALKTTT